MQELTAPKAPKLPDLKAPQLKAPALNAPGKTPDFKALQGKSPDFKALLGKSSDLNALQAKAPDVNSLQGKTLGLGTPSLKLPDTPAGLGNVVKDTVQLSGLAKDFKAPAGFDLGRLTGGLFDNYKITDWAVPDDQKNGSGNQQVAPQPAPGADSNPAPGQGSAVGMRAREYGRDGSAVNPNTGDKNWNGWCLGWVNQAFQSQGQRVPELQAETAADAYRQADANGKIQHGNPPPGSIVFFPEAAGGQGHVGIANDDGTYRGTVPPGENPTTIGDRPIPDREHAAWMMPPEG